jgi:DNA-binding transcriptional ArsR family regulator
VVEGEDGMIVGKETAAKILACLADPEVRSILQAVEGGPKTVASIRDLVDFPQSTLYRKMSVLRECGLLMVDRFMMRPDGKRDPLFVCTFDEIRLESRLDGIRVDLVESKRSIERRWLETFYSKTPTS